MFITEVRDTLTPALEKLADRAVDFTRNEDEMHAALAGIVQKNFDTRGGRVGGWPPRKVRRSGAPVDHPIMQQSGALQRSLTRRGAAGAVFEVSRDAITYGSTLPHALAHQRGVPRRHLPARRVTLHPKSSPRPCGASSVATQSGSLRAWASASKHNRGRAR